MIKQLLQLAAVLAITLFLASGCVQTIINDNPFDFTTMRKMETIGGYVNQAFRIMEVSNEFKDEYDMAWAYYQAGQVAVVKENYEEANEYFERALDIMTEILADLKLLYMGQQNPTTSPDMSF